MKCKKCTFESDEQKRLLGHYMLVHESRPNFVILCSDVTGNDVCSKAFTTVKGLKRHIGERHKNMSVPRTRPRQDLVLDQAAHAVDVPVPASDHSTSTQIDNAAEVVPFNNDQIAIGKQYAKSLVILRETKRIPMSTCSLFAELTGNIVEATQTRLLNSVSLAMQQNVAQYIIDRAINRVVHEETLNRELIQSFSETEVLNKFISEHMSYIPPVTVLLGDGINRNRDTMQYIPLLDTLKQLTSRQEVFREIDLGHQSGDQFMRDICDGDYFKNHPFWSNNPRAIQIILYWDEFVALRSLGLFRTRHKYAAFYFTIGNIPPEMRSKRDNIQLLAIVNSNALKRHGMNAFLRTIGLRCVYFDKLELFL